MTSLKNRITSQYLEAANRMSPKKARRRIVVYVESYDDIFFWRTALSRFENKERYFEVMLPSRERLQRGKKSALMNVIGNNVGRDMIACVDADYDYLLQGRSPLSEQMLSNPFVFHTYVYAIENYQCYAGSLHNVGVMVTLNDHAIFDYEDFMRQYSEAIYPLFVWSILVYRTGNFKHFSISDFNQIVTPGALNINDPQPALDHLRRKVYNKVRWLQQKLPGNKKAYLEVKDDLTRLGVTPQNTYLYIQGHHLFDVVVLPIMTKVCNRLRAERENEIHRAAVHHTQMRNELSCYENSLEDTRSMLRKNMGYVISPQFRQLQADIEKFLQEEKPSENDVATS